jgi:predicted nucleotidyltransferase
MNAWRPLPGNEQQAMNALIHGLCARPEFGVIDLILFGSKSRGDDTIESDIDIAVVVAHETGPIRDAIWRLGSRLSLEYDVLFNPFVIGQERWQFMREKGFPLARNIEREGIRLEMGAESAAHLLQPQVASASHLA